MERAQEKWEPVFRFERATTKRPLIVLSMFRPGLTPGLERTQEKWKPVFRFERATRIIRLRPQG